MPVPSIVTLAVAPPSGLRFTVVWKFPLPALPALLPVADCWLLVTAWLPVDCWFSIRSPSDCELVPDVLPLVELDAPPIVPKVVELLLVAPPDGMLELPDVLLPVVDEPELVLFALEEPDMLELSVMELPEELFIELRLFMELLPVVELLLDVLLAASELAPVLELLELPTIT